MTISRCGCVARPPAEADIEAARFDSGNGTLEIPVKFKVHDSLFVPLAKSLMLLAGKYRCIRRDDMISIQEAD